MLPGVVSLVRTTLAPSSLVCVHALRTTLSGEWTSILSCLCCMRLAWCCASDYGYLHADGFTGPCIRDDSIILPDPCDSNATTYSRSQGYRKVSGDVCVGGEEERFSAVDALCCDRKSRCHPNTLGVL